MELNKIFASILLAGIIGMACALLAEALVVPQELEQNAYLVELEGTDVAAVVEEEEEIPSVLPLLASADPAAGEGLARACTTCHTFEAGGDNRVGPNNWNIVNAAMGHVEGFGYSSAMQERHDAGDTWTYEALNEFLLNPREYMPGTSMAYGGMPSAEDRANMIAWLRTLSDDPAPLPTDEEIAAATASDDAEEAPEAEGDTPSEDAPAEDSSAEEAPAEDGSVEEAPTEDTSAEDAPAEDAPVEEAPADDASSEDAPAEDTAAEDAPAEEAAAEEAPTEDATAETASAPEDEGPSVPSVLPLLADADVAAGEAFSRACVACHTFDQGGPNRVGPNNWGVVGAVVGHIEGFRYSRSMQALHDAGEIWTYEALDAYLLNPREYVPGTTMAYAGIRDIEDRANVIAWLRTLSDDPVPLPTAEEIEAVTSGGTSP